MGKVAGHIYSPPFAANYKKFASLYGAYTILKKYGFWNLTCLICNPKCEKFQKSAFFSLQKISIVLDKELS